MLIPFFIRKQQANLEKRIQSLKPAKEHSEARFLYTNASNNIESQFVYFSMQTHTFFGYIKSFIPFTSAFKQRMNCAREISEKNSILNKVEVILKKSAAITATPKARGTQLRQAQSDSVVIVHKSPIGYSPRRLGASESNLTLPASALGFARLAKH